MKKADNLVIPFYTRTFLSPRIPATPFQLTD